jgi:DNA (cytosine-5)-methyltransferase 1
MSTFTHYSGFAGIGAFAATLKRVGGRCEGGFEWYEAAAAVFEKLNPAVRLEGDFRQIDIAAAPSCDVYDAGAPCQSFSVAGRKAGLDLRGNLMFGQLSYLRVHQPLLGVFEQVPNFAQLEQGELLRSFLEQHQGAAPKCRIHPLPPGVRGQALRCLPAPRAAGDSGGQV